MRKKGSSIGAIESIENLQSVYKGVIEMLKKQFGENDTDDQLLSEVMIDLKDRTPLINWMNDANDFSKAMNKKKGKTFRLSVDNTKKLESLLENMNVAEDTIKLAISNYSKYYPQQAANDKEFGLEQRKQADSDEEVITDEFEDLANLVQEKRLPGWTRKSTEDSENKSSLSDSSESSEESELEVRGQPRYEEVMVDKGKKEESEESEEELEHGRDSDSSGPKY